MEPRQSAPPSCGHECKIRAFSKDWSNWTDLLFFFTNHTVLNCSETCFSPVVRMQEKCFLWLPSSYASRGQACMCYTLAASSMVPPNVDSLEALTNIFWISGANMWLLNILEFCRFHSLFQVLLQAVSLLHQTRFMSVGGRTSNTKIIKFTGCDHDEELPHVSSSFYFLWHIKMPPDMLMCNGSSPPGNHFKCLSVLCPPRQTWGDGDDEERGQEAADHLYSWQKTSVCYKNSWATATERPKEPPSDTLERHVSAAK